MLMDTVDNAGPERAYTKNHDVGRVASLALKESLLCDREYSSSSSIRGGCRIGLQNEVARDTRRERFCFVS